MINRDMKYYDYFTLGNNNDYGQAVVSTEPTGKIKMAINLTSQNIQNNINYQDAEYIGLTHAQVDDTYIIEYEGMRLKVLYVNPNGIFKQVFLKKQ